MSLGGFEFQPEIVLLSPEAALPLTLTKASVLRLAVAVGELFEVVKVFYLRSSGSLLY